MAWYTDNNGNLLNGLASVYGRMGKDKYQGINDFFDKGNKTVDLLKAAEQEKQAKQADDFLSVFLNQETQNPLEQIVQANRLTPYLSDKGANTLNAAQNIYGLRQKDEQQKAAYEQFEKTFGLQQDQFELEKENSKAQRGLLTAQTGYYNRMPQTSSRNGGSGSGSKKKDNDFYGVGLFDTGEKVKPDELVDGTNSFLKNLKEQYPKFVKNGINADSIYEIGLTSPTQNLVYGEDSSVDRLLGIGFDEDKTKRAIDYLLELGRREHTLPPQTRSVVNKFINDRLNTALRGNFSDFTKMMGGDDWEGNEIVDKDSSISVAKKQIDGFKEVAKIEVELKKAANKGITNYSNKLAILVDNGEISEEEARDELYEYKRGLEENIYNEINNHVAGMELLTAF
jgi:hypothetical protein